jgi:electron transfer flavoprotein beta subunit
MIKFLSFNDFEDKNENNYGLAGSATQVERIFPPEKNTEKQMINGSEAEQTQALFELITNKKII